MPIVYDPERLLAVSNILYIASAVVTVLATFGAVYFGNRVTSNKDNEIRAYQADADARIAEAHTKAAESNAEAARANVQVAAANATAEQAKATASAANQKAEEARATAERSRLDKAKIEADPCCCRDG